MLGFWVFNETSPSAPGTAASSHAVQNASPSLGLGVAGPLDDFDAIDVVAELVGAQGGTLSVWLQTSLDEASWYDSIAFPVLSAGAASVVYRTSITHFSQPSSPAPVQIGKGLAPALAANTAVQGGWGSRARLVFVAGSGTTAGAVVRVTLAAQRGGKSQH